MQWWFIVCNGATPPPSLNTPATQALAKTIGGYDVPTVSALCSVHCVVNATTAHKCMPQCRTGVCGGCQGGWARDRTHTLQVSDQKVQIQDGMRPPLARH
jgi:hypothetical protein